MAEFLINPFAGKKANGPLFASQIGFQLAKNS
jgi:hypothetical protein